MTLPEKRPLIAFLGDDFTGSSAVMELMSFAGLPAVLFLDVPDDKELARFADHAAIGIATLARAKDSAWMDENLPAAFEQLAKLEAPISHYKVCSTFDSAPHVGSIGRAIDLAIPILGGAWHPLLVAAPEIKRYQLFGNLFAAVGDQGFRLDRHPTMAHHPTTPMNEADIRLHLAGQTKRPIRLIDYPHLMAGRTEIAKDAINLIDVVDEASLIEAGRLIWENRGDRLFTIGSQGIEYALLAWWRQTGLISASPPPASATPSRMITVSGSCSPVTANQIDEAERSGFVTIRLDVSRVTSQVAWQQVLDDATRQAGKAIEQERDPLIYTARGPDDPAIVRLKEAVVRSDITMNAVNERIGNGLGSVLRTLQRQYSIPRICIAGGDTSGQALKTIGITALEAVHELAPACAISNGYSDDKAFDGIQIALKGGQMGPPDYFSLVAKGKPEQRGEAA